MAVVEVEPERLGIELIREARAGGDRAAAALLPDPGHPVHERRVDAVEVDRVRVLGAVDEPDPQRLALVAAQRRPRHPAVVGPRRVHDPGGDLDLLVGGDQVPLAQHPPARHPPRPAVVEVAQDLARVEAVAEVVDTARNEARVRRVRRMAHVGLSADLVSGGGARLAAAERVVQALVGHRLVQQRERGRRRDAPGQQLPAADSRPGLPLGVGVVWLRHKREFDRSKSQCKLRPKLACDARNRGRARWPVSRPARGRRNRRAPRAAADRGHRGGGRRVPAGPAHERRRGAWCGRGVSLGAARSQGPHAGRHAGAADAPMGSGSTPRRSRPTP